MRAHPLLLALLLALAQPTADAGPFPPADTLPAPMLASRMPDRLDVAGYLASEKLDGVRARWDGKALWTRGGHRIDAPAWFTNGWPAEPMDGELWLGRGRFQQASDIVRAIRRDDARWRPMRFMAFDLPAAGAGFATRSNRLRALVRDAGSDFLQRIPQYAFRTRDQLDARLREVVAGGGEGLMLHHALAGYRAGRSDTLFKLKPSQDAEARVLGYRPGKGKYAGMVGALLVEDERGRRFALGSGLRDHDRRHPPAIGSRVTFRYDGLTARGTPRFARYLRVRQEE